MKVSLRSIKACVLAAFLLIFACAFSSVEIAQAEEVVTEQKTTAVEATTTSQKGAVAEKKEEVAAPKETEKVEKTEKSEEKDSSEAVKVEEKRVQTEEKKVETTSKKAESVAQTSATNITKTSTSTSSASSSGALEDGSVYKISSGVNGKYVLDVAGGSKSSGGNVQVYQDNGSLAQQFQAKWISGDWYYLINMGSGLKADVSGGSGKSGANVQQYSSNGTAAQKWKIVKNADGTYTIYAGTNEDLALDVASGIASNGQNVQIYAKNGTAAQKWYFIKQALLSDAATNGKSVSGGVYTIVTDLPSGRVIDVTNGSTANGANVQIYSSNSSFAQKVKINAVGINIYTIQFTNSDKVLDVEGGSSKVGANVQQYASNSTYAQYWYLKNAAQSGYYNIFSLVSGLVLDVAGAVDANGTNVQVYSLNNTAAQAFKLNSVQLINNGTYVIQSTIVTPMVLDISGGSKSSGGNAQIYRSNGTSAQKFTISYIGSGYYTITNVNSGLKLDVSAGSTANGANVQQYGWNGTDAQKWIIDYSNGVYTFKSVVSKKFLDVSGGSRFSGGNVQQYAWNGSAAQKWILRDENWRFYDGASSDAMRFIEKAEEYQGWRYVWGGRSPQVGFDCAGLVMYCANQTLGKSYNLMYTNAEMLYNNHCYQISASEARAGDLVFYRGTYGNNVNYISHVVIYCGSGIYYGAGDPIGYEWVSNVKNIYGNAASVIYARMW